MMMVMMMMMGLVVIVAFRLLSWKGLSTWASTSLR
jgi:hypothetical protein